MGNNLSIDTISKDILLYILKFVDQVNLVPVFRVSKQVKRLVNSVIVNNPFNIACNNGEIFTIYRYHRSCDFVSAFEIICRNNHGELVKRIIRNEIYKKWWNSFFSRLAILNRTLREMCKYSNNIDMIKWVINEGADDVSIALTWTCQRKVPIKDNRSIEEHLDVQTNIVNILLSHGAVDMANVSLYCAAKEGNIPLMIYLMKHIVYNNKYALPNVCESGNLEAVSFMLSVMPEGFDIDRLMDGACISGNIAIVEMVIKIGAVNFNRGLQTACMNNQTDIVNLMIAKGADPRKCKKCRGLYH